MLRLHCFSQSGNAFKVAFFLRAIGLDGTVGRTPVGGAYAVEVVQPVRA